MKHKKMTARNPRELAQLLDLDPVDLVELQIRQVLNDKIIEAVETAGITHAQVAQLAKTSRTRITAILNRNRQEVSTDLLLRIMASLGYQAKISFAKSKRAA